MSPAEKENDTVTATVQYQVVALKYRPQAFADLVGQQHIATALSNAIKQNRIGHAYLFTGARGVGKTSSRIFAKCLNCKTGPSIEPCNECDICDAISSGEDVDVLEIDGASNRGIDEIRQLRSNVAVRPSRSRFKIYIIDEVHMLTTQAFNALLKTLEEPPAHVKFIFCTTDPQKIPITVLSRCQRFDFSPVQTSEIAQRLSEIAEKEGVKAQEQALALLARRANGSMRDSQSLLEQLLSFCEHEITVEEVHQLLGTADMGRIAEIATAMANRDSTTTLNLINRASDEGVNPGQLATQLLGYFRDMMVVRVGCGADTLLTCTESDIKSLAQIADQLGLETILSIVQMLDMAVVRMQSSLHARTLLEIAAIRTCGLENLDSISDLVNQLTEFSTTNSAATARPASQPSSKKKVELTKVSADESKKNEIAETPVTAQSTVAFEIDRENRVRDDAKTKTAIALSVSPSAKPEKVRSPSKASDETSARPQYQPPFPLPGDSSSAAQTVSIAKAVSSSKNDSISSADIEIFWARMLDELGDMTAEMATNYEKLDLQHSDKLVVTLLDSYHARECNRPDRKLKVETTLAEIAGRNLKVEFLAGRKSAEMAVQLAPRMSRSQQIRKLQEDAFIKQAISLFDGEIIGFHELKENPTRGIKRLSSQTV